MLLHIQSPHFLIEPPQRSLWQQVSPRIRVLSIVLLVCAIALTPNSRWYTWGIYAMTGISLMWMSRVPLQTLGQRMALEWVFVCTIALGAIFSPHGTPLWQWGWLQITTQGLMVFTSVMVKALLSLLLLNILVLTTPISELLDALLQLRVPPLLIAILSSMSRYSSVLIEEFRVMQRAATARNLVGMKHWKRVVTGHMIGALFIPTQERGDRIYQAMLARGYSGLPTASLTSHPPTWLDYGVLAMVGIWILSGQLVYAF